MAESELPKTQGAIPSLEAFSKTFQLLTGNTPFPWQERLFEKFLEGQDKIPASCNLPTGLGKTNVIAIWLIALAQTKGKLPRRLVYVVNRRTVVDQTTAEVERIRSRIEIAHIGDALRRVCGLEDNEPPLAISTLRGQFADNREWSANPARPAVICGTVDMIGSRLLFSGYRIGFRSQPLHAGFLGQDALLVHDEAHLEPAFQKLIETIQQEQARCCDFRPLRVMELTATTRNENGQTGTATFTLDKSDRDHPVAKKRIEAPKHLHLKQAGDDAKIAEEIANLALERRCVKDENGNAKDADAAVLIFVRTPDEVKKVCDKLTSKQDGVPKEQVQQLTGTMRGLERDSMADPRRADASPVFARFLQPPEPDALEDEQWKTKPMPGTVFLVCTSAGEVGVNISADHAVCDLSTFESMVQRFGRVNRFGDRDDTRIEVVRPKAFDEKDKLTPAREATLKLLQDLNSDASPLNLGTLDPKKRSEAFAPVPTIPLATDILFDAWALTSIREPMPGRPEVAPYLHGIPDDLPQTTIVWRAELDLLKDNPNPKPALKAIFAKHRIRPHESLTVRSYQAVKFLKEITSPKVHPELLEARVALVFARGLELTTVKALIDNSGRLNADPTLVLPATFGGLDEKGMLAVSKPDNTKKQDTTDIEGDDDSESQAPTSSSLDIADVEGYERESEAKPRRRVLVERTGEGWTARAIPGADPLPNDWNLEEPLERSTLQMKRIQEKSGLKVHLVQPIKWDDEGDPVCALVCLSSPPRRQKPVEQTLKEHVSVVEKEAERLADALLGDDKIAHAALRFAAKWHDEGKNTTIWQRYIGRPNSNGEPLGKSSEWRDPKLLGGYRHEFGSLLHITPYLPDDEDVRELALHLIVAHHGYARPHFENTIVEGSNEQQEEEAHTEVIRRYARLQRRYGRWGLAYLESLLRAADWAASAAVGIDPEVDDDDPAEFERNEA